MYSKSGQVAIEYLMIVGLVSIVIIPTTFLFYNYAAESAEEIDFAQIDKFGRDVVATAETVFYLGYPSRIVLEERLPASVENMSIVYDPSTGTSILVISVNTRSGTSDFTYPTQVNLAGVFVEQDLTEGIKRVRVEAAPPIGTSFFVTLNLRANQSCIDGTAHEACTASPPKYCFNSAYLDNCQTCGCPGSVVCEADGTCLTPVILNVNPSAGPFTGGTNIIILGDDFADGLTLLIGGSPASVSSVTNSQIDAVTPAGSAGPADVVVTNPDGGSHTLVGGFTYLTNKLFIKDSVGDNAASIADDGSLVITGTIEENSVHLATASTEWIVRIVGEDVFILDTTDGNLYIDGNLFQNQATLTPPVASNNFIVKDILGNVVMYVDATGDLYLKGGLTENGSP